MKRFKLFPPTEGGNLYAYPVYHALDRRAAVDLTRIHEPEQRLKHPRAANAKGIEVVLRPGQMLYLPAYWWHEVYTIPTDAAAAKASPDGLTVSLNFWFEIDARRGIAVPLVPHVRLEFARQLESLSVACLGDAALVPPFLGALAAQWRAARRRGGGECAGGWAELHAARPASVDAARWSELFEYVSVVACLMLGAENVLGFLEDLCDPERFACVRMALEA